MRIGIIGGGPGGLMTAYLVARRLGNGCQVTLMEAAERPGGKLSTRSFDAAPAPYEAGAAELYDYSGVGDDPLRRLVDEVGVSTRRITGGTVLFDDRLLRDEADIARHLGGRTLAAIRDFYRRAEVSLPLERWHPEDRAHDNAHPWAERTCERLLDAVPDPVARRYLEVVVHSDLATEPHLTTGLNGLKNFVLDLPGYVELRTVEGGMSRLAEALVRRLATTEILCDARVARVQRAPDGAWRVRYWRGGGIHDRVFDAVVLALPASQLGSVDYEDGALDRAMRAHVARFDRPGHYLRVSMLFRAPFWRRVIAGSWFMIDAFGGACVYDESARLDAAGHGVLGWLLAGTDALTMAGFDEGTLVRRLLDALPAALRRDATEHFVEARVHRWCRGVSRQPGGLPLRDPATTHRPDADRFPRLLVVGGYLYDSTLNGVHQSADTAASLLATEVLAGAAPAGWALRQAV
jgi:monoamine oxidase